MMQKQYTSIKQAEKDWKRYEESSKIESDNLVIKFKELPEHLQKLYRPLFDSFMHPAATRVGGEELQKGIVGMALEDKDKLE